MDRRAFVCAGIGSAILANSGHFAAAQPAPQDHSLGLRFIPKPDFDRLRKDQRLRGALPKSASVKNMTPAIGDQGPQGSCVGWSVGYGLAGTLLNRKGKAIRTSPAYIYNRGMLIDSAANNQRPNCGNGMYIETALSYLQGFGILSLQDYPYDLNSCGRLPKLWEDQAARQQRVIKDWTTAKDLISVKGSLAAGLPAVIGIQLCQSFLKHSGPGVYAPNPGEGYIGGHAMLVVGYDDDRRAFQLMNSWRPSWGDQGYAWVSYETIARDATVDGSLRMYTVQEA